MSTLQLLGFRVVVSPVWLAGAALLVVSMVASLPLGLAPRITGALSLTVALLAALVLAFVIVAMEVFRAVVARAHGTAPVEVRILTLGVRPAPEAAPSSPSSEMLIALAAPLLGGLLGSVIVAASRLVAEDGSEAAVAVHTVLTWLGVGVLVVSAFRSLPLPPLDGGRFVRALAWRVSGDLREATALAAMVGRAFGYVVLGAGLVATFVGELLLGVWLLLLGWLATRVSRGSAERARLEELSAGLVVGDALDREPPSVGPSLTLDALLAQDEQPDTRGVYPIVEDGRLAGVVFTGRIGRGARSGAKDRRVADVMVPLDRLLVLREKEPLLDAVIRLERWRVDALPVVAEDDPARLVGLVTRDRVLERLRARRMLQAPRAGHAGRGAGG